MKGEETLRNFIEPQAEALLAADEEGLIKEMSTILPDVDKEAMRKDEDIGHTTVVTFHEALKNSADGWIDDDLAFIEPWGFDLSEIKAPVFLWQGSADLMVPFGHGKWLSKHIPKQYLKEHLIDGQGHLSIWQGYMKEMLKELASARV